MLLYNFYMWFLTEQSPGEIGAHIRYYMGQPNPYASFRKGFAC